MSADLNPLTIDPRRHHGDVCIGGTRVPAYVVAEAAWGENGGVDQAADDYDVTRVDVLLACWWWVEMASGVESFQAMPRRKNERRRRQQWKAWARYAMEVLGGHVKGLEPHELCDPDDYEWDDASTARAEPEASR